MVLRQHCSTPVPLWNCVMGFGDLDVRGWSSAEGLLEIRVVRVELQDRDLGF